MRIPIVIAAYNRPDSLERLLRSLKPTANGVETDLIISIDGNDSKVIKVAQEYIWQFGRKELKINDTELGLKHHLLQCIQLGLNYDGIIVLEDDLWLSPVFTQYNGLLMSHLDELRKYSSFAFYHQHYYPSTGYFRYYNEPFCYSSPYPCSSGFMMLNDEIRNFMDWIKLGNDENLIVPQFIRKWTHSWKKTYAAYMLDNGKEVLYPPASVITNFGDAGVHHKESSNFFQSPLMGEELLQILSFKLIKEFDVFLDLSASMIKQCVPDLEAYEFEVDLSGSKALEDIDSHYLLSSKKCFKPIFSWSNALKPVESNLVFDAQGEGVSFGKAEDFVEDKYSLFDQFLANSLPPRQLKRLLRYTVNKILERSFYRL